MAKLLVQGDKHDIELTFDEEEGGVFATCIGAQIGWSADHAACEMNWRDKYDDLNDATQYCQDHADRLDAYSNLLT